MASVARRVILGRQMVEREGHRGECRVHPQRLNERGPRLR